MDLATRERLCNECLDFVRRAASSALEGADEAGLQKSSTLRGIVKRINQVLEKIDAPDQEASTVQPSS